MCRQNHSFIVDYFALGVIAYEFMLGRVLLLYINFVNFKNNKETIFRKIKKRNQRCNFSKTNPNKKT